MHWFVTMRYAIVKSKRLLSLIAAVLMTLLALTSSFFIHKPALRSYLIAHLSQRIDAEPMLGYHRHLPGLPLTFTIVRQVRRYPNPLQR